MLVDEIRTAFPHDSDITSSAVHEFRYLGAVIEEGLHLAPPVPEGLARIVAPEGVPRRALCPWRCTSSFSSSSYPNPPTQIHPTNPSPTPTLPQNACTPS